MFYPNCGRFTCLSGLSYKSAEVCFLYISENKYHDVVKMCQFNMYSQQTCSYRDPIPVIPYHTDTASLVLFILSQ